MSFLSGRTLLIQRNRLRVRLVGFYEKLHKKDDQRDEINASHSKAESLSTVTQACNSTIASQFSGLAIKFPG